MRFSIFLYLFAICVTAYSQNRICFIDSLDTYKGEIEELERYNLKKMQKLFPVYRKYSNLKQLHFFCLQNKTNCPITKEEYLDYSFFNKMQFSRGKLKTFGFRLFHHQHELYTRYKQFLIASTFVFTPEGNLVGMIRSGFVENPNWMEIYNTGDLGRLVAENKISFAFCGGNRHYLYTSESFNGGGGDMDCVVIDGKIFLLNNLGRTFPDTPDAPEFHLLPWDEFIEKQK